MPKPTLRRAIGLGTMIETGGFRTRPPRPSGKSLNGVTLDSNGGGYLR